MIMMREGGCTTVWRMLGISGRQGFMTLYSLSRIRSSSEGDRVVEISLAWQTIGFKTGEKSENKMVEFSNGW